MRSGSGGTAPSSRRPWPLAAALLLGLGLRPAVAQTIGPPSHTYQNQGIEAGHLVFYPSLLIDYGYDDNIFYSSGTGFGNEQVPSRLTVIQPRLEFDVPRGQDWVRWTYSPVYRNYSTSAYTQLNPWSHFFDLDGRLTFGTRGFTTFKDHFVKGSQELQEVDPGGELTFGLVPFRTHNPMVEVGMNAGVRQAVSVVWNYDSTQFENNELTGLFNFRGHGLEGRYNYQLSPDTKAYLFYGRSLTVQARDTGVDVDVMTTGIGLEKTLNRSVVTQVMAGYQEMDFTGAGPENYAGPVLSASAAWQIDEITRVAFSVRRQPYQSFYLNNNFYLDRNLSVSLARQVGSTAYWTVGVELENNRYSAPLDASESPPIYCMDDGNGGLTCPSDGVRRRDRGWRLQAGMGFQMSRSVRAFLGYNYQVRSSNMLQAFPEGFSDPFNYTVNRLLFRIEVGVL